MTRVALKGMKTRRLRTALTALAIVLGVAMVSGAYTLTDTMRGAADSLSDASYQGTAAVVSAKTAFEPNDDFFVRPDIHARRSTPSEPHRVSRRPWGASPTRPGCSTPAAT